MKTITTTIISLALLFIISMPAQTVFGQKRNINPAPMAACIEYDVFIQLPQEQPFCGTYLIMVTDGAGNLVAPAQSFIDGVTEYTFKELGYSFVGMRTAKMVVSPTLDPICDQLLSSDPASLFTYFVTGVNYPFTLFPNVKAQHEE